MRRPGCSPTGGPSRRWIAFVSWRDAAWRKPSAPAPDRQAPARTSRRRRSTSLRPLLPEQVRQPLRQDLLGLARDTADDLARRQDLVDQAGILSHRQHGLVDVAALARRLHAGERLRAIAAQGPLPARPAIDETVAARARHRARPY